jgi:hypothetical protein
MVSVKLSPLSFILISKSYTSSDTEMVFEVMFVSTYRYQYVEINVVLLLLRDEPIYETTRFLVIAYRRLEQEKNSPDWRSSKKRYAYFSNVSFGIFSLNFLYMKFFICI